MSDSTSQLPRRPSLEQLRKQATDRVKTLRAQGIDATLADVQFTLAREYGFKDWADLAHHVETINPPGLRTFEQMAAEIAAAYSSGDFHAFADSTGPTAPRSCGTAMRAPRAGGSDGHADRRWRTQGAHWKATSRAGRDRTQGH